MQFPYYGQLVVVRINREMWNKRQSLFYPYYYTWFWNLSFFFWLANMHVNYLNLCQYVIPICRLKLSSMSFIYLFIFFYEADKTMSYHVWAL